MLPLVSIVTVNYNGRQFLNNCFDSLLDLNYPKDRLEIIMVDNGSSDNSVGFVESNYPGVRIIRNKVNNYCAANNLGIAKSKGEYIGFLNNDTKVDKDWLIELIKVIDKNGQAGAVAGKTLFPDGRLQGAGHFEFPNFYWADRGFKEEDKGQYSKIEEIKSLSNCAALYRRKCLDSVGNFDEDFNMFVEDVDMSIRTQEKGWRLIYVPASIVSHEFHGSARNESVNFYCEKNRLLLLAKHYPEKLAEALFGKGYFTRLNNRNEVLSVLPSVFAKLIKHQDKKTIVSILPGIFDEVNKILNLEKDHLINELNSLRDSRSDLLQEIAAEKVLLIQKASADIAKLQGSLTEQLITITEKDRQIHEGNQRILEKDRQIHEKNRIIQDRDLEISRLEAKIKEIFCSETYRFVVLPIWKILGIFKSLLSKPKIISPAETLVIKPYSVSVKETELALEYLRKGAVKENIVLVANVCEEDYNRLSTNNNIAEGIFYRPGKHDLSLIRIFKLIVTIRKRKFLKTILLIGNPVYQGYRKGKLLAGFSGSKNINAYFIRTGKIEPIDLVSRKGALWSVVYGNLSLLFVLLIFLIVIIIPLKVKKFLKQ